MSNHQRVTGMHFQDPIFNAMAIGCHPCDARSKAHKPRHWNKVRTSGEPKNRGRSEWEPKRHFHNIIISLSLPLPLNINSYICIYHNVSL